jgi:hypothetical protein
MPQGPVTRIVIRRPNGRVEVIGRVGHHDPHRLAREFSGVGVVTVVRHELMPRVGEAGKVVAIHRLELLAIPNLPPSYATLDRCLALIPAGYDWVIRTYVSDGGEYLCHIMGPEYDAAVRWRPGGYLCADDQPHASFRGRGSTPAEAVMLALMAMEQV